MFKASYAYTSVSVSSVLGFDVAKTGDARIGFVGFPSVGKSTLLSNLAGVYSEVAAYEFTTLTTVPGVVRYKGAKIQVGECGFFRPNTRKKTKVPCSLVFSPGCLPLASGSSRNY